MMSFKRTAVYATLSAVSLGLPAQSLAQGNMVLEEVIVTARKKEERLQTTPIAITALNEQMLFQGQVAQIGDLRRVAPNLSIMQGGTGSSALVFLSIRGNAQVAPNAAADAAVGTYIDGVYFARPTGGNLDMFDMAQVEVLRGPQGTLFGRNTTGGALNILTNAPDGELDGYLSAQVGNYSKYRVEAVANVPLAGEELAARFAVRYQEHDGYGDYKPYSDPNGFFWEGLDQEGNKLKEDTVARARVKWQPDEGNVTAHLSGWYAKMEDSGQRSHVQGINSGFVAGPFTLGGLMAVAGFDPDRFIAQQEFGDAYWNADNSSLDNPVYDDPQLREPQSSNENKGGALELNFEIGDYFLKSITAYHETDSVGVVDLDGTPLNLLTFHSEWNQDQWSQEFQLSGEWGDKLDWIAGAYYFTENSDGKSRSRAFSIFTDLFAPPLPPGTLPIEAAMPIGTGTNTSNKNTSTGVFVQGNYSFTDTLRTTAGLRWTWDERDIERMPYNVETSIFNPDDLANCGLTPEERDNPNVCKRSEDTDFDYPAWILSLDYQYSDDLFMYAKTSGASMAGGWNVRGQAGLPAFEPEDIWDVELGFKADLLEDTLRFNTAVFYMWAKDQQRIVNEFLPATSSITQYVRNAAESKTWGAEFELTYAPWQGMTLSTGLAYLNAEYDNYDVTEGITTGPNAGQTVVVDHSGENSPHAPEYTVSIGATQIVETSWGELELHADYYWVDDTWFQDNTVRPGESAELQQQQREEQKFNFIPSYGVFNAMVTLRSNDEHWEFNLWGKNLADEDYYTGVANFYSAFGTATIYLGEPRTYGAEVRYNW